MISDPFFRDVPYESYGYEKTIHSFAGTAGETNRTGLVVYFFQIQAAHQLPPIASRPSLFSLA